MMPSPNPLTYGKLWWNTRVRGGGAGEHWAVGTARKTALPWAVGALGQRARAGQAFLGRARDPTALPIQYHTTNDFTPPLATHHALIDEDHSPLKVGRCACTLRHGIPKLQRGTIDLGKLENAMLALLLRQWWIAQKRIDTLHEPSGGATC